MAARTATLNRDQIIELADEGLSFAEIGRQANVSRQRVQTILKSAGYTREKKVRPEPPPWTRHTGVAKTVNAYLDPATIDRLDQLMTALSASKASALRHLADLLVTRDDVAPFTEDRHFRRRGTRKTADRIIPGRLPRDNPPDTMQRFNLCVDAPTEALFTTIGDGSFALGIREAVRRYHEIPASVRRKAMMWP